MVGFFIHTLVFLGNYRGIRGSSAEHPETSRVGNTDCAADDTKHGRWQPVVVLKIKRDLGICHARKSGAFKGQPLDTADFHTTRKDHV
jgi:hypothetical protein